jgi:hypothetical protein
MEERPILESVRMKDGPSPPQKTEAYDRYPYSQCDYTTIIDKNP